MKLNCKESMFRIVAFCLCLVMCISAVFPVYATKTSEELESELTGLNSELKALDKELEQILSDIEKTSVKLENTREELAVAKGFEETQYESMKLRIKYMYENGNANMLELIFSSSCMSEFINRAEYYSVITEYDRKLLSDFAENSELIAEKEKSLVKEQKRLQSLQEELNEKEQKLSDEISSAQLAKLELAKKEAEEAERLAQEKVDPIIPEKETGKETAPENSYETSFGPSVEATASDVELLAALIECEAGSRHYEGMLAVGSVVVNRMKSRHYPDTLRGVIYQSGQFTPAHDGKLQRVLERGVKDSCVVAARDALNGKNNVGDCVSFRAASSGRPGTIIGDNVFF